MLPNNRRIAKAAREIAADITAGRFAVTRLGKGTVFKESGAACCITGHVISRAGLKRRMRPFRTATSFDGGPGPRWWSSADALGELLCDGVNVRALETAEVIEALNDGAKVPGITGNRRQTLPTQLIKLAEALEAR